MLINSNIWALIEREVSAFQALQLYDATVVVHAHDFLRNVLLMSDHPLRYGGDYLQMEQDLVKALSNFNQCNIRPIFIFGGASTLKASRVRENIRCLQRRTGIVNFSLQHGGASNQVLKHDYRNGLLSTPVFAKETLVGKLDAMGFLHATCDADSNSACVALAAYLRCPLVANSNELLLFEFEEPSDHLERFIYVPLRFLSSQPVPQTSNPPSLCLIAHAFSPLNSSIHRIPYFLRPFFAVYFKPPNGSYFSLPRRLYLDISKRENSDEKDSTRPMVRRAKELISWLESIDSPINAFDESVQELGRNAIPLFVKEVMEIASILKIDMKQGEDLARYLFPDVKPREQAFVTSMDLITFLAQQPFRFDYLKQYVDGNETKSGLSECKMANFLSKVPSGFLRLYRSGFLSTVVFTRILSSAVVLPVLEENPTCDSVMECSIGIRYLQYCLALDFVRRYDEEAVHLNGFSEPTILEFSRSKDTSLYRRRTLTLKPSLLPTPEGPAKACTSFIYKNTGYQMKSVGNWIEMLALTLTLWHINTHPGGKFNILNQTTALAVALVVCAVEASNGGLNFRILNVLADDMTCAYHVDVVHEINEIQLMYISLLSLLRLVNAFSNCEGVKSEDFEILSFPQGGRIFPSSRLIHNLAVTLKDSQDRESLNIWLERLLYPIQNVECVQKATESMIYLARILCEMWIVRPIEFSSHCELLPFSADATHQGRNKSSPSQQIRPFHHESDLQIGRDGMYITRSSARRTGQNRANDRTCVRSLVSCELYDKAVNNLAIESTSNGASNHEKILRNDEETRFVEGAFGLHRKWGRNSDIYSKMGVSRPFASRRREFCVESRSKGRSTNPFLPDYIPPHDRDQRFSHLNIVNPKNPFLSDFGSSCLRAASECRERQHSGRVKHSSYGERRESATLPASEHGFQTFRGNCFQPAVSESGDGFSNSRAENRSVAGEKLSPTSSYSSINAGKAMNNAYSRGDYKNRCFKNDVGTPQFKENDCRVGALGSRVPFSRNSSYRNVKSSGNNSQIVHGKQVRPFNGFPWRGRASNRGFCVNRPFNDRYSNINKQEFDPKEIADAIEKLALDFS